ITMTQPFGESKQSFSASLIVLAENGSIAMAFLISIYLLWSYRWGDRLVPVSLVTIGLGAQMVAAVLYARELVTAEYGGLSFFNCLWVVAFAFQPCCGGTPLRISRAPHVDQPTDDDHGQLWVEDLVPSTLVL